MNDAVNATAPYSRHTGRDTRNDDDNNIATGHKTNGTLVTLKDDGAGKLGLVVVGIDPAAVSTGGAGGGPGGRP